MSPTHLMSSYQKRRLGTNPWSLAPHEKVSRIKYDRIHCQQSSRVLGVVSLQAYLTNRQNSRDPIAICSHRSRRTLLLRTQLKGNGSDWAFVQSEDPCSLLYSRRRRADQRQLSPPRVQCHRKRHRECPRDRHLRLLPDRRRLSGHRLDCQRIRASRHRMTQTFRWEPAQKPIGKLREANSREEERPCLMTAASCKALSSKLGRKGSCPLLALRRDLVELSASPQSMQPWQRAQKEAEGSESSRRPSRRVWTCFVRPSSKSMVSIDSAKDIGPHLRPDETQDRVDQLVLRYSFAKISHGTVVCTLRATPLVYRRRASHISQEPPQVIL